MPERDSYPVGSDTERLFDLDDARLYNAAGMTPTSVRAARGGFRPSGGGLDPGAVFASGTPDTWVHVTSFVYWLPSTRGQGVYTLLTDGQTDLDILGTDPADSTHERHDLIIAHQSDAYFQDPDSKMRVRRIKGDPAAAPQDPSLAAYPDHVKLARINVRPGASTIEPADIDDLRPVDRFTVALGGILPVADVGERNAITNPYDGLGCWRRDRDWLEVHDGTAWRVQGVAICTSVADRDTAITHPRSGQLAQTTDIDILWQYDGATSKWQALAGKMPRFSAYQTAAQSLPDGAWTPLNFGANSELEDTHSGHNMTSSTSRYVVPLDGRYRVRGKCTVDAIGSGKSVGVAVMKNGSTVPGGGAFAGSTPIPSSAVVNPPPFACVSGDYIQVAGYQLSGAAVNTASAGDVASTIDIEYIGP